jgi:tetrahydromethanopterin S-methyltransferase subunit F
MTLGPLDGPVGGRARGIEGTLSDHTVKPAALRNDELLHDAGLSTGLSTPVKVSIGVVVAVVLVLVLVALLGS